MPLKDASGAPGALPAGRVLGIKISLEPSLLFLVLIVTFGLGSGLFAAWHPEWGAATRWATALAAAALLVVSILLHELSHALVARLYGMKVKNITLFMFGGLAGIEREPPSPMAELMMAIVGPITSLFLGIASLTAGGLIAGLTVSTTADPTEVIRRLGPGASLLLWLGPVNIVLSVFNMLPGFPLDGGRVLRALLWMLTGSLQKATRWATFGGQIVGYVLMGTGLAMTFGAYVPFLGGGLGSGIWLLVLGWLLSNAARASYAQMMLRTVLEGVPVSWLMKLDARVVEPGLPLSELVDGYILQGEERSYPVVEDGKLLGMIALDDVRKVPREAWPTTSVEKVMTPVQQLTLATPGEDAFDALRDLNQRSVRQLPVVDHGKLVGVVHQRDVLRWLEVQSDRDLDGSAYAR
jgi:Zn-dependent protease/CBS domain-containing protein